MKFTISIFSIIILFTILTVRCYNNTSEISEQNGPPELVNTESKPINNQWKGTWSFQENSIFFSNELEGGRLNGLVMDTVNHFTALITAENYPINQSPWYAFKIWSLGPKEITVRLTYTNSKNRYYPKMSTDGQNFQPMDSSRVSAFEVADWGIDNMPELPEELILIEIGRNLISRKPLLSGIF